MSTKTKLILTALIAAAIIVATVLYATLAVKPKQPPPDIATPSPSSSPTISVAAASGAAAVVENIAEAEANNPVLRYVPKSTPFWMVEYLGGDSVDSKIPLTVTVFILPDRNPEDVISSQYPRIEAWLAEIGQPAGTYTLQFKTDRIDSY